MPVPVDPWLPHNRLAACNGATTCGHYLLEEGGARVFLLSKFLSHHSLKIHLGLYNLPIVRILSQLRLIADIFDFRISPFCPSPLPALTVPSGAAGEAGFSFGKFILQFCLKGLVLVMSLQQAVRYNPSGTWRILPAKVVPGSAELRAPDTL